MNKRGWKCPICATDFSVELLEYYSMHNTQPTVSEPLYTSYEGPDRTERILRGLGLFIFGALSGIYVCMI